MIPLTLLAAAFACAAVAIDGDTIKLCGGERVRLLAIDSPEMPGHCRRGRRCVKGDPFASKRSLARALSAGPVRVEPITRDRYGRIVGIVRAGKVNASCYQLAHGAAVFVPRWDRGRRVERECGRG